MIKKEDNKKILSSQQKKYLSFHEFYRNKAYRISIAIASLDYLTSHEAEWTAFQLVSPNFANTVIESLWTKASIDLSSFFYESDERSFKKFFDYVKANWNLIFTEKFVREQVLPDGTREQKIESITFENVADACAVYDGECAKHSNEITNLKHWRDNYFAHFTDMDRTMKGFTLQLEDLMKLFKVMEKILNKIEVLFDGVLSSLEPINKGDVSNLCFDIKVHNELKKNHREIYDKIIWDIATKCER